MNEEFISRTPNGLYAEATVRDVSFIFHIEGKGDSQDIKKLPDYIYYDSIISHFFDGTYEIKVEGGKQNINSMVEELALLSNEQCSHIVFMDRDHDEVVSGCSSNKEGFVFYTLGYSYENDFWTSKMSKKVLSSLISSDTIFDDFLRSWKKLERQISFIHKFNLLSKVNGKVMFNFKGLCGVTFEYKDGYFAIDSACVTRFKESWNRFGVRFTEKTIEANKFLKDCFYAHPGYLIQGHAYESYVLEAIHQIYMSHQIFEQKAKVFALYKNIAFTSFSDSPCSYLSQPAISYYETVFARIASA